MPTNQIEMIDQEYVPFAVEILVSDFEKSLDFYKKLKFDVVRVHKSNEYDFATLSFNDSILMIKQDRRTKKRINGNSIQLRFIIDDLEKYYAYVQSQKIAIFKPMDEIYYGLVRFSVSDPDGYEIKFAQKPIK